MFMRSSVLRPHASTRRVARNAGLRRATTSDPRGAAPTISSRSSSPRDRRLPPTEISPPRSQLIGSRSAGRRRTQPDGDEGPRVSAAPDRGKSRSVIASDSTRARLTWADRGEGGGPGRIIAAGTGRWDALPRATTTGSPSAPEVAHRRSPTRDGQRCAHPRTSTPNTSASRGAESVVRKRRWRTIHVRPQSRRTALHPAT